ncbi:MAG: acetylxylan esterase [Phocaeicola sp.]
MCRKPLSLLALLFIFVITLTAQIRGEEIRVVVSPNHTDWHYKLNEPCEFTIQVYKAQNLLPGVVIDYELGPEMYPTEKKSKVLLQEGKLTVRGKLDKAGFLRCKVKAHVDGKTYEGSAAVGYEPQTIQPYAVLPTDFLSFWRKSCEEARHTALEPTFRLLPERCTHQVDVYEVSFHDLCWGSRTYGILSKPKAAGTYPALLRVPGAGVRPYYGDVHTASKGVITLEIGIHGIPVTMQESVYQALFAGALHNYWQIHTDSKENNYYKRVLMGAIRAVDFLVALPECNGEKVAVAGSSQGGALSVMVAALHNQVTSYAAVHPALCDHAAFLQQVAGGWPHYFFYNTTPTSAQVETSYYYDVVNFAKQVTVPGWFSWGYNDEVCTPTSMYAAYNSIAAPKELHLYLETAHFWYQEQYETWNNWLLRSLAIE